MKYKLIKPVNPSYSATEQILTNRGVKYEDINHYINTTDDDINSYAGFGMERLEAAAALLISAVQNNYQAVVVVDSDCDGFTSAALLINYLYKVFPSWVQNCLSWYIHTKKQHGLSDCYDKFISKYKLVFCPDSGTNDIKQHQQLKNDSIDTIVLDHHLSEGEESPYAIIINNQTSNYYNKELSGVGVVWQFCKYLDTLLNSNYADRYLDLVALGLTADMQSMLSIETKHLINKGFLSENVKNPFIYSMWQHNKFKLGEHITSWGAAFYIAPLINAIVRSGTQDEKNLVFESMLDHKANQSILSNKRGHKFNETELLVEQAIRTCINVKNRQTRVEKASLDFLEQMIEEQHLLEHKVLFFLLEPGQIDRNVAGLIANRFMSKYQRPCCILSHNNGLYQGSMRGCEKVGIFDFKAICEATNAVTEVIGHPNAAGLTIKQENVDTFLQSTDEILSKVITEPTYYVDYIYENRDINLQNILDIADMDCFWGKDMDEALIAIHGLKITQDMVTLMSPDKNPTLKIQLPELSIINFGSNEEEYKTFAVEGYIEVNIIGKANKNEWNGKITPQIFLEDYEIINSCNYYF